MKDEALSFEATLNLIKIQLPGVNRIIVCFMSVRNLLWLK